MRIRTADNRKSYLSNKSINEYKSQITKIKNKPVCSNYSTFEVSEIGVAQMATDRFRITKKGEQFDV